MPFRSKAQWRQCFAAARQGKRNMDECLEFARATRSYKKLPEKVQRKKPRRVMRMKRRR